MNDDSRQDVRFLKHNQLVRSARVRVLRKVQTGDHSQANQGRAVIDGGLRTNTLDTRVMALQKQVSKCAEARHT